jgi:predicted type IV restriction endonuclease
MTEAELKAYVKRLARMNGWRVMESKQNRIVRPPKGDSNGFPDLVLARDKEVLFIELKTDDGILSSEQYAWSLILPGYCVIRPKHLDNRLVELLA